jgi:hypothetical protein
MICACHVTDCSIFFTSFFEAVVLVCTVKICCGRRKRWPWAILQLEIYVASGWLAFHTGTIVAAGCHELTGCSKRLAQKRNSAGAAKNVYVQ